MPCLTLPKAVREAGEILADSASDEAALLNGLRDYLGRKTEEVRALVN